MAPPAKRRRRNLVESDDEDDSQPQPPSQQTTPRKSSLKDFLLPSPTNPAAANPQPPVSPIPKRRTTTRSAAAAATAAAASKKDAPTNGVAKASAAPPSFLNSRGRASKASTKSPSASPEKRRAKTKVVEEKGRNGDLLLLFSKQAQRAAKTEPKPPTPIEDIISDPISEDDDNVAASKAAASSIVGRNATKRFRDGGSASSSQQQQSAPPGSSLPSSKTTSSMFRKPPRLANSSSGGTASAGGNGGAEDLRPWSERFGPANLEELAVHKKKVADVRRWLEDVTDGRMRQRLLILKGAAGSGKTTTVRLLAKELRCEVLEWRNPTSTHGVPGQRFQSAAAQFEEFVGRGGKFGQLDLEDDDGSPTPRPANASVPDGQSDGPARRLMLVEEFPNTFMRSSSALTSFRSAVLQFLATNTPSLATFGQQTQREPAIPVVMIISETLLTTTSASADSFTAHRLLGPEILRHPGTGIIEFNAIAPSILFKALELVVQKEARKSGRRRTPGPVVLKKLGEIGDIRNAISSLEFLCLKGDADADWGAKVTFAKAKKGARDLAMTKGERESLELVSQREASLGIFHAVGKVVYNKRDDIPYAPGTLGYEVEKLPRYMSHLSRPKQSLVSVDTLIDETGTDTSTFISALHENYALSCEATGPQDPNSAVDYLNGCLDFLSDSDLLCPSWDIFFGGRGGRGGGGGNYYGRDMGSHVLRQDEMAFEVVVRGMLFSLPSPVKRQSANGNPRQGGGGGDQYKMFFPTSIKLWRAKEELEALMDMWSTRIVNGEAGLLGGGGAAAKGGAGHQHLGSGPSVFRKPRPIGGGSSGGGGGSSVGSRAANRTDSSAAEKTSKDTDEEIVTPPLSLGSSARKEMLLDRLPYMAHMARRRRGSFLGMGLRDLEKVVSFQGIGGQPMPDDEEAALGEDDDDAAGGNAPGEGWATDKPTEEAASPRKRRANHGIRPKRAVPARGGGGADEDEGLLPGGLQVQKLMLSDDEIEDD